MLWNLANNADVRDHIVDVGVVQHLCQRLSSPLSEPYLPYIAGLCEIASRMSHVHVLVLGSCRTILLFVLFTMSWI